MTASNRACVLAIALQKGGVGKTTSAVNLAVELALLKLRVLLIDLDQQANATKGLGIQLGDDDATMYEVLHDERGQRVPLCEVIKTSEHGIDVAPAHFALRKLEKTGLGAGGQKRLRTQIETLEDYDIVIIDCPPSLGELTTAAIVAADSILATVMPGPDEVDALLNLGNTILDVQEELNPTVEIGFVLVTNFDSRTQLGKDVRKALRRDWPDEYLGEISVTVRVGEAKARAVPIAVHAPNCTAAEDYRRAARAIAERMKLNV